MADSEAELWKMLPMYKHRDLSALEIMNVIGLYRDLKPLLDNYVFNDGTSRELLSLSGTIPVPYKGNTYNIPICLWLLENYPYDPPICFVKPTSTMTIKIGKHVDANGKIYIPYLHEWKHPPSDLLGLIQILIIVFGEKPPVFFRSAAPAPYMYPATGPPNPSPTLSQDDDSKSSEAEGGLCSDCEDDAKSYVSYRAPTQESDAAIIFTGKVVVLPRTEIVETATQNPQSVNPDNQQAIDIYLDCLQKIRQVVDDTEAKLLALKAGAL